MFDTMARIQSGAASTFNSVSMPWSETGAGPTLTQDPPIGLVDGAGRTNVPLRHADTGRTALTLLIVSIMGLTAFAVWTKDFRY